MRTIKKKILAFFTTLFSGISVILVQSSAFALDPSKTVDLSSETKVYINRNGGITTNIFVIESENDKKFFKECKEKLSMLDTVKRTVTEYFNGKHEKEQQSILKSLSNEENLNKFFYMKTYGDGQAAKWLSSADKSDTSIFGLTEPLNYKFKTEILPDFYIMLLRNFFSIGLIKILR